MNTFLIPLIFAILPIVNENAVHEVDYVEHNYFYDENAKEVFQQYVYWKKNEYYNERVGKDQPRFVVAFWRIIKGDEQLNKNSISFFKDGVLTKIKYKVLLVSHTQYDPELADRNLRNSLGHNVRGERSYPIGRTLKVMEQRLIEHVELAERQQNIK